MSEQPTVATSRRGDSPDLSADVGRPDGHYVTTSSFVIECICGRVFSERTEAQARRRHDEHRHLATAFEKDPHA